MRAGLRKQQTALDQGGGDEAAFLKMNRDELRQLCADAGLSSTGDTRAHMQHCDTLFMNTMTICCILVVSSPAF